MSLRWLLILTTSCVCLSFGQSETLEPAAVDESRVKNYLSTLTRSSTGKTVQGVKLSNGTTCLGRARLLGNSKAEARGQHIYLFEDKGERVAYIWVEAKGKEIVLPKCYQEHHSLSEVYTLQTVGAGDGLVITECPDAAWFK